MAITFFVLAQLLFVACYRSGRQIALRSGGYEALSTSSNLIFSAALLADVALIIWGFFAFSWWVPIASALAAQVLGSVVSHFAAKGASSWVASAFFYAAVLFAGLAVRYAS